MKYIRWIFGGKKTWIRVVFLLCTLLLDLATIVSYTALEAAIPSAVFCVLLFANIVSTAGTILNLCFTVVPDVCGLEYAIAIRILEGKRLHFTIISDDVIVVGQTPPAGRIVRRGIKVKLKVAKFTDKGTLQKVNVAIDEISEAVLQEFRFNLAMAGQSYSMNRHMTLLGANGTESRVEVVFTFEFTDTKREFIVYCEGLYEDGTPQLCFSRLMNGNLEEIEESDWKRIRTLMRYLAHDSNPLRAVRYGADGIELL